VDLAHEALMDGWARFADWRSQDRDLRRLVDRLEKAYEEWVKKSEMEEYLLPRGLMLEVREQWKKMEILLSASAQEYYQISELNTADIFFAVRTKQSKCMTMSLAVMLKRALEQVDFLITQKKIWTQLHNQPKGNLVIGGDIAKIEKILHVLLVFACGRSSIEGRIDLWCRQIGEDLIELSITDYGTVSPDLLQGLHQVKESDPLSQTLLEQPPGLHLAICQKLMLEAGGVLSIYQLEDNRILSRLILPLAGS